MDAQRISVTGASCLDPSQLVVAQPQAAERKCWKLKRMKEQLTKLLTATPFVPFTIKMSDGQSYEVRHPENLAIGKLFMVLIEPESDRTHDLCLLHVTSFERNPTVRS